jgi:exportin-T
MNGAMPPPSNPLPLPASKRQFLSSLLDVLVRQLAWPQDADWEAPGTEDPDPGDDMAMFQNLRIVCHYRTVCFDPD